MNWTQMMTPNIEVTTTVIVFRLQKDFSSFRAEKKKKQTGFKEQVFRNQHQCKSDYLDIFAK